MGNCNACVRAEVDDQNNDKNQNTRQRSSNLFSEDPAPIRVLNDVIPLSHRTRISDKYILGRELGRGEFGITYLCTDRETGEGLACKSISKRKLRTAVRFQKLKFLHCEPELTTHFFFVAKFIFYFVDL